MFKNIIFYFLEIGDDRPYTNNIKACVLYTTIKEGAFIHYLCVHSSYRYFDIGTFMLLILQARLNFRGNKISLHLQANNTTSACRYYHNMQFCETKDFPKYIKEATDEKLFDTLKKLTLVNNILERLYYSLPNNNKICREINDEELVLQTISFKNVDAKSSEFNKNFFVFPFNCIGQEIENILSKHAFCWLGWSGFYLKDKKDSNNYILSAMKCKHPAVNSGQVDANIEDNFRNVNTYY